MEWMWTAVLLAGLLNGPPPAGRESLPDVFERVHSSVVTIRVTQRAAGADANQEPSLSVSIGSGVLVSPEGDILTAAHLVQVADLVRVEFSGGGTAPADVIAVEPLPDLALVRLREAPPEGSVVASLADSDRVRIGAQVFVIGAPLGASHTLTVGHISARRMDDPVLGGMRTVEHFQTDAAINKGNSGGPMFSMKGEVIGVVCHILSRSGGSQGLGFAVTSNAARQLLLRHRPFWLGFNAILITDAVAGALNVPGGKAGLLVQRVALHAPADEMGVRAGSLKASIAGVDLLLGGDIILEIQGHSVGVPEGQEAIARLLRELAPGDEIRLKVLRKGSLIELSTVRSR